MSVYYESLDDKAKARYRTKLELAGLSLQSDPYAPENQEKFQEDMTAWPPLEYGHIFCIFCQAAGSLHSRTATSFTFLEANGRVQLLPERPRPYSVRPEAERRLFRFVPTENERNLGLRAPPFCSCTHRHNSCAPSRSLLLHFSR